MLEILRNIAMLHLLYQKSAISSFQCSDSAMFYELESQKETVQI